MTELQPEALKERTCELVMSMLGPDYTLGVDENHPKLLMTLLKIVIPDSKISLKMISRIMLKVS